MTNRETSVMMADLNRDTNPGRNNWIVTSDRNKGSQCMLMWKNTEVWSRDKEYAQHLLWKGLVQPTI